MNSLQIESIRSIIKRVLWMLKGNYSNEEILEVIEREGFGRVDAKEILNYIKMEARYETGQTGS